MLKIVSYQIIQFSISTQFSSIRPIDTTLSGATTPDQSGPGSDDNEELLRIPQSSSITGTSLSDCLVSYAGHSLGGFYPEEIQSVYSSSSADLTLGHSLGGSYPFAVMQSVYSTTPDS